MDGFIEFSISRESFDRLREQFKQTNRAVLRYGDYTIPLILSRDLPSDSIEFRTRTLIGNMLVRIMNIGPRE